MHGTSIVDKKQRIKFLGKDIDFFELDDIKNCDLVLGWEGINKLGAILNIQDMTFTINKEEKISNVNYIIEEGIIRRSNSPYYSPIWTVAKTGIDEPGKPKRRMVIHFQKLNSQTIEDRYTIPDINMTIHWNLGSIK